MCGIAGYIHFNKNQQSDQLLLKKMTDIIAHRGPDGEGFYVKDNIALGHRRLSIIDLKTGDQPMSSDDLNKVIVFNGEIYNYIELREELITLGHSFKTNSDTEVIIKSYEQWGYDCQNRFNGMWAFAIWDDIKQELFLSRDRFGEKPLHYTVYNNTFVFGSEIKSLSAYGVNLYERHELIQLYLVFTYIPAPDTFYKNIFKLMSGHYLVVKEGCCHEYKYWELPQINEENMYTNKEEVYSKFTELLNDAIKIRMRSDVPFGAFLSGGLDSSSIVSQMAAFSEHPINTFTIGFDDVAFDESTLAQEVAEKFKTNHQRETVKPEDIKSALEKASYHFDEPFGDSSCIPADHVSKFASKKVKMVLTGDGGDEALSGYISYTGIKLSSIIKLYPLFIRKSIILLSNSLGKIFKGKTRYKLNKFANVIETAGLDFNERMAVKGACTDIHLIKALTKDIKGVINIDDYLKEFMKKCRFTDDFYKLMYFNYMLSLPNDYLVKVDRMSMANSLETRLPFLDFRLVEFMAKVHKDIKMQGWERKSVLRHTIAKSLPSSILKAPKKGFGIPLREWFKEKDFKTFLGTNLKNLESILDKSTIQKIISENKEGKKDNGNFIWALLILNKKLDHLKK
jgi:asparagine synthase (glutamine-hydrolysing)